MPALHDLQTHFLKTLTGDAPCALPVVEDSSFTAEQRLQVYRNNTQFILRDLLKDTFPATALLLGDNFMHGAARAFIASFPPETCDINDYGAAFPDFLDRLPGLRDYAYVPDVARLEWAAHESYLSPCLPALAAEDLSAVDDPLDLLLPPQPHLRILRSGWPVDKIWERVGAEGDSLRGFAIKPVETFIAVYREGERASVWTIPEGGYKFLEHLTEDGSFSRAADAALKSDADFPLDTFLAVLVQNSLLAKE